MAINVWDSSALAKLYVPERGSAWALEAANSGVAVSALVLPEVASALARRFREGQFDADERDRVFRRFLDDMAGFSIIEVNDPILMGASAGLLRETGALLVRTLDAIHLSGAIEWFQRVEPNSMDAGVFIVADTRLRDAATRAGLPVENPEDHV